MTVNVLDNSVTRESSNVTNYCSRDIWLHLRRAIVCRLRESLRSLQGIVQFTFTLSLSVPFSLSLFLVILRLHHKRLFSIILILE